MIRLNLDDIIFYPVIVDVFNLYLDAYSLFPLSNTSNRRRIDSLVRNIDTFGIHSTYRYSHREYFSSLMSEILYSTLNNSYYSLRRLNNSNHNHRGVMFFCSYEKCLGYFADHKHETYEDELNIFCGILAII